MLRLDIRRNKLLLIPAIIIIKVTLCLSKDVGEDVSCHYSLEKQEDDLLNVSLNINPPPNSIFFIETSCTRILNSRQICSVESAARHHPNQQVNVLFAGPVINFKGLTVLRNLKNVKLHRIHLVDFAKNTPLYEFIKEGGLFKSLYRIVHTSDFLRLLTLYKFGGIYLDLDLVVAKRLWSLGNNWVARESAPYFWISNAVIAITRKNQGWKFIKETVNYVKNNYRGDIWAQNGPVAVTAVMRKMCPSLMLNMTFFNCKGFHVYGPALFFPSMDEAYYFGHGNDLFPHCFGYHVWNSRSKYLTVHPKSRYAYLARKHCPATYQEFGNKFGT